MLAERYIRIPVITHQNKIYKYDEVEYVEDEYYGNHYKVPGSRDMLHELEDAVYDAQTKKILDFVSVDIFPNPSYKIGDVVYREVGHRNLIKDKLANIKFEEYKSEYNKFGKLEKWQKDQIPEDIIKSLKPSNVVEFRKYESTYIFESGFTTTYNHMLYKVEE